MTKCLNCAVHLSGKGENGFETRTESSLISKGWKRLQIRYKKRGLLMTDSIENRSTSFDQYFMLEDDGYEEGVGLYTPTNEFHIDDSKDMLFIPQWSKTMIEPPSETSKDKCSISSSDDEYGESSVESVAHSAALTSTRTISFDEVMGAFPKSVASDTITMFENPSISMDDIEEMCGVSFLRPGDHNRRKKYRTVAKKVAVRRRMSDSETDEDSSSLSSIPDDVVVNDNDTSFVKAKNTKERRSIRFSDEVRGQSLTTIHLVPWSEHEDPEWIPRPVRCRIEL